MLKYHTARYFQISLHKLQFEEVHKNTVDSTNMSKIIVVVPFYSPEKWLLQVDPKAQQPRCALCLKEEKMTYMYKYRIIQVSDDLSFI